MENIVIDILTSYSTPHKVTAFGNEAIARGALEAGVTGIFSYPGTPSTEISEVFNQVSQFQGLSQFANNKNQFGPQIYFEYSINEKIALEKAIAFSICNKSSMCIMKNVGMNVASDALMSITYQTIIAPLVIIVCDDPGCHSSSNEQDSRYWGYMASVPVFNPASPKDAYEMTIKAFQLSSELRLPVIVRTTTRVSHTKSVIEFNEIKVNARYSFFERLPEHINIPARTATAHQKLLDKLNSDIINPYFNAFNNIYFEGGKKDLAIISSGVSTSYIKEILQQNNLNGRLELFDIGLIYPFPEKEVLQFLNKNFKQVLIVEELNPIVEKEVRSIAQKNNLSCEILGKGFAGLPSTGEFTLDQIEKVIGDFFKIDPVEKKSLNSTADILNDLPPRPPTLCSGCPHRATYYALKLIVHRYNTPIAGKLFDGQQSNDDVILCGDIGCAGLGALPPLKMIDTINHMGMSISMAQGLSEALKNNSSASDDISEKQSKTKVIAMLGDGTFFHSGIPSLLNAVYTKSNLMVIIFDNRTIGMTGHQDHPGATNLSKYHEIEIPPLLKGMGIEYVETIMPFDIRETYKKMEEAISVKGISVLVSKAPCVFLPEYKKFIEKDSKIIIDHSKCNTCYNHADSDIQCSRNSGASSNLARAVAKIVAIKPVDARDQSCPANICNHGFFISILEREYKNAIDIVRDKILFARTCGDICHRPCELFSNHDAESTFPIKQLKKFVSGIEENFKDFSSAFEQIEKANKKNKNIAIIGAGPAGLSAAYDLIRDGFKVTVYEKEAEAGGLIKSVIPDFRMDKTGFDFEVSQLEKMGVQFQFNTALGKDIHLEKISDQYDGVIVAIGLGKSKQLEITNSISEAKKFDALSFLNMYNLRTLKIESGSHILVVGGGNSAIDVARSAKRFHSSIVVVLSCIESRETMPAFNEEVEHAIEEGITIVPNSYVASCKENGQLNISINQYDTKNHLQDIKSDYIIVAIGQLGKVEEYEIVGEEKLSSDNKIKANTKTGFTDYKNVFVAGDICLENHMSLIGAIASGKRAVVGIKQKLEKYQFDYEGNNALLHLNSKENKRQAFQTIDNDISSFINKFNLFQSCEKCNHCIDNLGCPAMIKIKGKIVIDYPKCTKCGLCIDVCPNDAIHWQKESEMINTEN